MIRGSRNPSKIHTKSIQIRCSKKVCKKHEQCSKMDPKWEPKSIQILQKTKFTNVLIFWIDFWRPLVPILLAKWSPTRRTSSRKPNKKGKELEGNSQDSFRIPTRPRRGGEPPARSGPFWPQVAPKTQKMSPRMRHQKKYENLIEI